MLAEVLTPGRIHIWETGTSCISWIARLYSHPGTQTFSFPAVSRPALPHSKRPIHDNQSIPAKAWIHLAWIQLQKPNYGSQRTKLHSVGKTHIAEVSKPLLPSLPPLAVLPRMTSVKVNKIPWHNCLGLLGYVYKTMTHKTVG